MRSIPASRKAGCMSAAPALSIRALNVRYPSAAGEVSVVRDFSLSIACGECVGVVGESGAGKSQAFLAVLGLAPRSARLSGSIQLGAMPRAQPELLRRVRGAQVAMVFQDPGSALTPHLRIADQIAEVLVRHRKVSWRTGRTQAQALLEQVHVNDPAQRLKQYPHELSGGMRQRVMIAMALACEPTVLIADEPTTALDVTIQAQILALLAELKRERRMAIALISHDLGVVAGLADRVAVMQAGRIVELAPVGRIFSTPEHPHTRELLQAMPRVDASCAQPAATASVEQPELLRVSHLAVRYRLRGLHARRAELRALDDVSLTVHPGESVGIVGESGAGKSTLVRAVLQLLPASAGEVVWLGTPLAQLDAARLRRARADLQIIFQDPPGSLDPRMTALESVAESLTLHRPDTARSQRRAAALEMLARVGLSAAAAARFPHELSGGQCQRVAIARAMILRPKLLVCDEPVSALDVLIQAQIVRLIAELRRESATAIVFVSHNLAVVRQLCDRVLVLYLGRAMELAAAAPLYAQPLHPYTRALLEAIPLPDPERQPQRLSRALQGEPPSPAAPPSGCVFRTRCPHAVPLCAQQVPPWSATFEGRWVACHRAAELSVEGVRASTDGTGYSRPSEP